MLNIVLYRFNLHKIYMNVIELILFNFLFHYYIGYEFIAFTLCVITINYDAISWYSEIFNVCQNNKIQIN